MHTPVLQKEILQCLDPQPDQNFIDATVNGGGHSQALLEKTGPGGKILAIDWDKEIIAGLRSRQRLVLVCDNFANLKEIVKREKFTKINGILFDLGFSSWHLTESGRGFSFQKREPLDMRYSLDNQITAEKIVNYWSRFELEKILKEYGEEKFAQAITENIIEQRKKRAIRNTSQLVEVIKGAVPRSYLRARIHFSTRTFQALRIAVNDELNNIEKVLPQTLEVLEQGGRLALVSFHSLEDRIVKNFLKENSRSIKILTKKPITPSLKEVRLNPRARSAKLRAGIKI